MLALKPLRLGRPPRSSLTMIGSWEFFLKRFPKQHSKVSQNWRDHPQRNLSSFLRCERGHVSGLLLTATRRAKSAAVGFFRRSFRDRSGRVRGAVPEKHPPLFLQQCTMVIILVVSKLQPVGHPFGQLTHA